MLYARINRETKEVLEFPLTERQIRDRLSSTTLPKIIDEWALLDTDYAAVPPGASELKPTNTHRVGAVSASYNAETGEFEREYGLIEIEEWLRPRRTANRWRFLREQRAKALRRTDILISRYQSEVRQGLTPTSDIAELDAFAQKLRDMTATYGNPYMIDEATFFNLPE